MKFYLTDKKVVGGIWHFLIEDALDKKVKPSKQDWEFVTGIFNNDSGKSLLLEEVKNRFCRYFFERCGIELFIKCPMCNEGITLPRVSNFGYFIGCSCFPRCQFIATNKTKRVAELRKNINFSDIPEIKDFSDGHLRVDNS